MTSPNNDKADGGKSGQLDVALLRAALDASQLLILVVNGEGTVLAANHAVERATGLTRDDCLRPLWELAALPDESARLRALFTPLNTSALCPGILFHLAAAGGRAPRVVNWDLRILDEGGASPAPTLVLTGIDVSERLAAERRLHETEVFQRQILDRLPAIVWTTDKDLRITLSSGGDLLAVELRAAQVELVGASLFSYLGTDDTSHPAIAPHLRALDGTPTSFEIEWFGRRFSGRVEALRDRHGEIIGTIGLAMDVTEKARTAAALLKSEAHVQLLVDANVVGIAFWDEAGQITEANQALLDLVGYSREELLSGAISWQALTPPEYALRDEAALVEVKATGRCAPYEKEYLAKDGSRVAILVGSAAPLGPGPKNGVSFVVDMREQVRLRNARDKLLLDEQSARIETALANARLMLLVDGSKRLSQTKSPVETLETLAELVVPGLADWSYVIHRGWDESPVMVASAHGDPNKRPLLDRLHGCTPDPVALEGAPRVFRTGEVAQYDDITSEQLMPNTPGGAVVGTRNPHYLHILRELGMRSMLCVPIAGRTGTDGVLMLVSASDPHRYDPEDVVLARDLTARAAVSLENGRLLVEALEAVRVRDDFLAVAAHELRTPLTSLLLQIQLLERGLDRGHVDPVTARRSVAAAQHQARRMASLIDGLLDVARVASNRLLLEIEDLDLRPVVDGLLTTMAPDFLRAGCVVSLTAPATVTGRWDRVRIEQVLTNLLINALKFGPGRPIEVKIDATPSQVEVSVRDHGIGISKADQARIFGRFERAVSSRHFGGLGLGLHISTQILRAHQGSMRVDSQPGQGACFTVVLPRRLPRATISAGLSPPAAP